MLLRSRTKLQVEGNKHSSCSFPAVLLPNHTCSARVDTEEGETTQIDAEMCCPFPQALSFDTNLSSKICCEMNGQGRTHPQICQ